MAPPPCASMRGISYFMHSQTPVRLIAQHAVPGSSGYSGDRPPPTAGDAGVVEGEVEPAVGGDRRRDQGLDRGGVGHVGGDEERLAAGGLDLVAVSRPPATAMSATTTRAPSRAKASAVARPMPDPPPVTSATLPSNCPTTMSSSPASRKRLAPPGRCQYQISGTARPSRGAVNRQAP